MVDEWGEESAKWVDQQVKVHSMKQNVSGKFIDVFYIAPDGYEMGDYGFEKSGANEAPPPENQEVANEDVQSIPF